MNSPRASVGGLSLVFVPVAIIMLVIAGWMISRDPLFSGARLAAPGEVVELERSRTGANPVLRPVGFRDRLHHRSQAARCN